LNRFRYVVLVLFLIASSLAIAQSTPKTVVAVSGDGIHRILKKNGLDPVKYYKAFIALNKKRLGPKNGLFIGTKYVLPEKEANENAANNRTTTAEKPGPKTINEPLFGEKYASITMEDESLSGAIYYLISGHGGPDPGALISKDKKLVSEDEYAYDVNLRLARRLMSKGATVYIIVRDPNDGIRDQRLLPIDYDEVNYPNKRIPRSQRLRLRQRTESVNALFRKHGKAYQRLIVTHVDSRSVGEKIDVFFYHHKNSKKGKSMANALQNTFKKKYARYQPNRKYAGTVASRSGLYVIRNTLPAMVYIELGNLKNTKDQKRILDYNNRDALAKWIFEGLVDDFSQQKN